METATTELETTADQTKEDPADILQVTEEAADILQGPAMEITAEDL